MFRDGVGDSQVEEVFQRELSAIIKACMSMGGGYRPKVWRRKKTEGACE